MMSLMLNHETTIGELVASKPSLSKIFEKAGIDYCCGGKKSIAQVCGEKGLDIDTMLLMLGSAEPPSGATAHDLSSATLSEMTRHIYQEHHVYLYEAMPRLSQLVDKVARVHGENEPRLAELRDAYAMFRAELEIHMKKEENVLFPYCEQLETAKTMPTFHCGAIANPIRVMEQEHESTGRLLERMRQLTDDYTPPSWACNTYRAMLDGLSEMEADVHQHIHEENNILFPKALKKMEQL